MTENQTQTDLPEGTPEWRIKILDELLDGKAENKVNAPGWGIAFVFKTAHGYLIKINPYKKHPKGLLLNILADGRYHELEQDDRHELLIVKPFPINPFLKKLQKIPDDTSEAQEDNDLYGFSVDVKPEVNPPNIIKETRRKFI